MESIATPWETAQGDGESSALQSLLVRLAVEAVRSKLGLTVGETDPRSGAFAVRLWEATKMHLAKQEDEPRTVAEVEEFLRQVAGGRLHYGQIQQNVVEDLMVAQGLQMHLNEAAEVFERDYMPSARRQAEHFAGSQGLEAVDSLAAELVLPRKNRPPKIATYRGLTPLKSWLRSVVVNQCVSAHRARREVSLDTSFDTFANDTVTTSAFAKECETRLAPEFQHAVMRLSRDDRVLIKMLVLDGVSQKNLAKALGVNSGTLTRRRQKAAATLLQSIRDIGAAN
ncbi:MAG: hypothetical protein KDA37_14015, partial [Planctomycetales bacterium]|nr:hypothetical protein [Planctomycetales bacterium]